MENTIKLINAYEDDYEQKSNELRIERDTKVSNALQEYADKNAKFKIGDFLKPDKLELYIKVDTIEGEQYWRKVDVLYSGLRYKKVNGKMVRTKRMEKTRLTQSRLVKFTPEL